MEGRSRTCGQIQEKSAVGIIFTGALARGYFDKDADIDMVVIGKKDLGRLPSLPRMGKYKGYHVDYCTRKLGDFKKDNWSMPSRWALSEAVVHYGPSGIVRKAIKEKARYRKGERKWLMMEGLIQSEWFCKQLPETG